MNFLDCGCCIKDDGARVWCPSCLNPQKSTCSCGDEGYPGIAHDFEMAKTRIKTLTDEILELQRKNVALQNRVDALLRQQYRHERDRMEHVDLSDDGRTRDDIYSF